MDHGVVELCGVVDYESVRRLLDPDAEVGIIEVSTKPVMVAARGVGHHPGTLRRSFLVVASPILD